MKKYLFKAMCVALLLVSIARAEHFDAQPKNVGGKLAFDAWNDASSTVEATDIRVFGYDFQEDPGDPYFITDPGFNATAGLLTPGSTFGIQLILADLRCWDGSNSVAFGAVPDQESLVLSFGSSSRTIGADTGIQTGFNFGGPVLGDGSFHKHLNAELQGNGGSLVMPRDGIYLVGLTMINSALAPSAAIWIVYNNGLSEALHDQAIEWVQNNLVTTPEPTASMLVSLGTLGIVGVARRRRRCNAAIRLMR